MGSWQKVPGKQPVGPRRLFLRMPPEGTYSPVTVDRDAMSSNGGTIGARTGIRITGDRDQYVPAGKHNQYMGECREHGVTKRITGAMIEAWAESDLERMTYNGWSRSICEVCSIAISGNGECECGILSADARTLRLAGLGHLATVTEATVSDLDRVHWRDRPDWVPTAAELPDLPDDASASDVAAWKALYRRMTDFRSAQLANTKTRKSPVDCD